MSYLQISSLVTNRGMGVIKEQGFSAFERVISLFDPLSNQQNDIYHSKDVILENEDLRIFKEKLQETVLELLPLASNSKRGLKFQILGEEVWLNSKEGDDREIKFFVKLYNMIDDTFRAGGKVYFLDTDQTESEEGDGIIFGILRKSQGRMSLNQLLAIFNANRKQIDDEFISINKTKLLTIVSNFSKKDLLILENDEVRLTDKSKAILLH